MVRRLVLVLATSTSFSAYVACVGDTTAVTDASAPDASTADAPLTDASPGDGSADASTDVAPSLGCPSGCLPSAPSGWVGPSAVYDGPSAGKPTGCVGSVYTQKELDAYQGLDAGPATCSCGTPTFGGDGYCSAGMAQYTASDCSGAPSVVLGAMGGRSCENPSANGYVRFATPSVADAGTCSFPSPTTTLPDASFAAENVSCGLAQATACPTAPACVTTPVPSQPFTRICIHQDGDAPCPSADYSQRFVAYRDFDDTRSCSACAGTAPTGTCSTGWASFSSSSACNVAVTFPYTAGSSCVLLSTANWVGSNFGFTGTTCAADGGAPQGDVTATNPVTFCCNN
jgi:hypothetical protein